MSWSGDDAAAKLILRAKTSKEKVLDLSRLRLRVLPTAIGRLTWLLELDLRDNLLEHLPSEIGQLTRLRGLCLRSNQLTRLPPEIGKLRQLRDLQLSSNQLIELPLEVGHLAKLQKLNLTSNSLSSLPPEIGQLKELQQLDLRHNQLRSLPSEIGMLDRLSELKLGIAFTETLITDQIAPIIRNNQLVSLPIEIGNLTELRVLDLGYNRLRELPREIGQLKNLRVLNLRNNQLNGLPPELGNLEKLAVVQIERNAPKSQILERLADRGTSLLLAYLRSLEDAEPLYEGKLLLIGEGAVGKSTLLAALRGEEFMENRDSTHGVEVRELTVPHPERAGTSINLRAWDFGGQPVYRISHQFFYSRQAIYLVLWEARRGYVQCEVKEWIERIKLRVGTEARILVVATHCRTGDRMPRIDHEDLLYKHRDVIAGFFEIDSKTGHGLAELKQAIAQQAMLLPQMGDGFSERWKAMRESVEALPDQRMAYAAIVAKGHAMGLEEIEVDTLLHLMHDVGVLIFFAEDEELRKEVILDPEWLAKALSLILEDPRTNNEFGVLEHSRLSVIWEAHRKSGLPRYPSALHPFLLRLMEKYDVCYRLEGVDSSLVGQLVPETRPSDLPWTGNQAQAGQVALAFDMSETEVPPGLIPWLIVRTHRFATKPRRHWQRGTFLSYGQHGEALIELRERILLITVRADWPGRFMTILHDTLDRLIEDRWPGLEARYKVPCPGTNGAKPCTNRFPLEGLRRFKKQGISTMPCQTCTATWSIDQLLTGFHSQHDSVELIRVLEEQLQRLRQESQAFASATAEMHFMMLRVLASENKNCPRTFTLIPLQPHERNLIQSIRVLGKMRYRLSLWCEHPDAPHPVSLGSTKDTDPAKGLYIIESSEQWLRDIAPLANTLAKTLKYLIPVGGNLLDTTFDEALLKDAKANLELMEKLTTPLLEGQLHASAAPAVTGDTTLTAEGAALREFHSMLLKLDPNKTWGGLRRVLTKSGDYLWLCPHHYKEFEPPLLTHLAEPKKLEDKKE